MSNSSTGLTARALAASLAVIVAIAALPAALLAVSVRRFGHLSPLDGMRAPWKWSMDDVQSWGRRLTKGLDSSAELVDLFFRFALVAGWVCLAILLYTVVDECLFQIRHGMPSARRRRSIGIGPLGRHLATALVALLPLSAHSAPPALASTVRAPASVVSQHRVPDRDDPIATPQGQVPSVVGPDGRSGWSVVEVQRGDSVWAIAERFAEGRDVSGVARQIVAANLGTVMPDGHRFSTPALIEPGWLLSVPTSAGAVAPTGALADAPAVPPANGYTVKAGDSYWDIAEQHMDPSASGGEIAVYARRLIEINAPLLGYSDARLLRPGDVVQLGNDSMPEVEAPAPTLPPVVPFAPVVPTAADESLPPPLIPVPGPSVDAQQVPTESAAPLVPPPSAPASSSPVAGPVAGPAQVEHAADDHLAVASGLAAAVVLAGGAVAALASRRRQQLRGAQLGARLVPPAPELIETERLLRSLNGAEQLARIDLAVRSAAGELARQAARPLAIEISDDGEVRLYTDRATTTVAPHWLLDVESGGWRLPAEITLAELATDARRTNQPCPALVHLGASAGGQLFVDLEAVGVLSIAAPSDVAASIVRAAAASLAVSPFAETSRVLLYGLEPAAQLGSRMTQDVSSVAEAIGSLRANSDGIAGATGGSVTTFALRAGDLGGEAWEPTLLLAVGVTDADDLTALAAAAGAGGRGVGIVVDRPLPGVGAVLRADDGDFVLEPLGRRVTPVGVSVDEVTAVGDLLEQAQAPLPVPTDEGMELPFESVIAPPAEFGEQPYELVVHVLGQVAVQTATGVPVAFDRSKAQELVVWLSQHRTRPTRASARTALWDLAVRDATFSNVVSDPRRAMAKLVPPPIGQEWIARTMTEELPLHDLVVSDADLLAARLAAAHGLGDHEAIAVLRPGVALIQGMPFAGTSYLWPDAEGITSSLVLLATGAAAELAGRCLAIDDIDGVFWATGQGLKVLAGHEELIALRMRAHAGRGDLAGVRSEWESYERALHADSWSAAEPSPKLVELRRELLSPSLAH